MLTQVIGWTSSFLLVLTLGKQVWKQLREGATEGISVWLFLGQMAASVGFTIYSWLRGDWIFVITNGLMLLNAVAGYLILLRNRRRKGQS